mgnify:CR=1 FL=1
MISSIDFRGNRRRKVFTRYILARAKGATLAEDPIALKLDGLGEYLGVRGEIRRSKQDLWGLFPPDLADVVERLITGEPWTEDADRSAAGIHGTE